MNNKISYFSLVLLYSIFIMFVYINSAWSGGTMSGNLSMRGQVPVAVIDFLSAETNYLHSITSKTDNPGLPQSVCVDAYRQSAIYGVNDIPAGYAIVTATLQNGSSGALLDIGKNNGLYVALSSLVTDRHWSGLVYFLNYTILIEYRGDAPCYLDASL